MKERDVIIFVNFSDNIGSFQAESALKIPWKALHLLIIQVESTLPGFSAQSSKTCASLEPYLGEHW